MDPSTPADSTNNKTNTGELSHIELTDGHVKPVHVINKSNSCSSSSSTSSDSSDGDFFQLDPAELDKPVQPPGGSAQQQSLFTTVNAAGHEDMIIQHKAAAAELGGPTQSPQVQAMGRSDVPDPNRIPSSVFARTKSATPMEWSVASNESLFSIHMGNSSFSRDHVFLLGSPMVDSSSPSPAAPPFSPASSMPGSSLPPLSPAGPRSASQIHEVQSVQPQPQPAPGTTEATNAEAMKDVLRAAAEEHNSEKDKPQGGDQTNNSARLSRQSDGSATSFRSFAFPILTGEGRSGSVKVEVPEQQQQQSQTDQSEQQQTPKAGSPKATPAPAPAATEAKGWLSCFSCCPFCR